MLSTECLVKLCSMTRGTHHIGEKISGNTDSTCTSELECFHKLNSTLTLFSLLFLKDALGPLTLRVCIRDKIVNKEKIMSHSRLASFSNSCSQIVKCFELLKSWLNEARLVRG